jgi:hypothetical protein
MVLHIEAMASVAAADAWCVANHRCHGFSFLTQAASALNDTTAATTTTTTATSAPGTTGTVTCYFKDETQIFFMDSQLSEVTGNPADAQWTSHVVKERAPPLSEATSGVQVWVKDLGAKGMAVLLVNEGQTPLVSYDLSLSKLPKLCPSASFAVRDLYLHKPYCPPLAASGAILFADVAPHDSVFLIVTPT